MDVLASSNDFIWAYYGNVAAAVTPATYATNGATWAPAYRGVWHLGQPGAMDSTANGGTGTASGNTNAVGVVANGQGFGGSQYINCGNSTSVNVSGDMTLSAWVKRSATGEMGILSKWGNSWCWDTYGDKNSIYFNGTWVNGNTTVPVGQWAYLSLSFVNATKTMSLYYNGQPDGSATYNQIQGSGANLCIGQRGDNSGYMNGLIDEARLEAVPRSSNWMWACYMTMASNSVFSASQSQLATPVISNQGGVSNKTAVSADLNGYLSWTGSAPTEVTVYYGRQDQYPSRTGWDGFAYLGTQAVGSVQAHVAGLTPNTSYVYRCYATNAVGDYWAAATGFTTPPDALVVDNDGGASGVTAFQVTLNGDLVSTGGAPTAVWVFFGDAAHSGGLGNTDKSQWLTGYCFGSVPQGAFLSTNVYGLSQSTVYYYNFYASNVLGTAWGVASNFTTLPSVDYNDRVSGVWNSTNTWTPTTGYPSNAFDSATIVSSTIQAAGGYTIPSMRLIAITTNASGSATGTLWFADATVQAAPLLLNGGVLKLQDDGNYYAQPNNAVTVQAASQITLIGTGNHRSGTTLNFNGAFQDSVQGGVTNTGAIVLRGTDCAGMNLNTASTNFSGGWDILVGPYLDGDGRPALNVWADGALGSGTVLVRNALDVYVDQTNAPAPARVIVPAGAELWQAKPYGDASYRTIQNWEIELQGGTLGSGEYGQSQFLGGHLTLTSDSAMYGHRDYRGWGPDFRYGGTIVGAGRLTIDADRGAAGSQVFRLSGNNTNFSGGVTVLWNALYVESLNALGTGDCWFDSADTLSGGVYLNTTPATTNWVLPNNFGGIGKIQVQSGSSNYVLTVPGKTVQPGTTVNAAGQLAVVGNLAFSTNAAGGLSTLIVDVIGTNGAAGVDYDQLTVTAGNATLAASLPNCALVVTTSLPGSQLAGLAPITILTATNADFSATSFGSVVVQGAAGQVRYNNGNVQVQFYAAGTVLMVN